MPITFIELNLKFVSLLYSFFQGSGHELFGYEVSTIESSSNYLLTCEDLIKSSGCIGCCAGDVPTIDELSFMLTNKKTGSSLIHIHTAENLQSNKHELAENFRMVQKNSLYTKFTHFTMQNGE